jgi:predicted dehydrogenase
MPSATMESLAMKQVNIGFVGCGFMGQLAHLANFAADPRCRAVALADPRQELARKVADRYSIPTVYRDHTDLIENADVEAIVEITQDDLHAPIAIDAMREGKHVYTEKPISTSVRIARDMVRVGKKNGVKIMVSYMKRYDAGVEMAKKHLDGAIADGSMGELTFARSHCFGGNWICNIGDPIRTDERPPPLERTYPSWLPERLVDEYRTYLNVYCHNVNLLRHFLGDPKAARFSSFHPAGKVLLLEYKDFPAIVESGWFSASSWDEQTQVYFRDGRVTVDTPPPLLRNAPAEVEVYRAGSVQQRIRPHAAWSWSFQRSAEHFIDCILKDETPRSSGEDSLTDVKIIEEAFETIRV